MTRRWGNPCMGPRNPGLSYTAIARMLGNSLMTIGKKCQNHVPRNSSVRFHSNLLPFVVCLARRRSPGSFLPPGKTQLLIRCRTRDPFVMASKPARSPNRDDPGNGDCSPKGPPPANTATDGPHPFRIFPDESTNVVFEWDFRDQNTFYPGPY